MTGITGDLRFAARALWRHRAFTMAVVLTLAVGFGATSAVFSVYRAALLRPLAISDPHRLLFLHRFETRRGYFSSASYPAFVDYRDRSSALVEFAAYTSGTVTLEQQGRRRLPAAMVSAEYFRIAGVPPLRGRLLDARDGAQAAVIGEAVWADAFQRDESVVGRTVTLDDRPVTIVGVLPASFRGFDRDVHADVWLSLEAVDTFAESAAQRGRDWLEVPGRLRPGVSAEAAAAALRAVAAALATEHPVTDANWRLMLSDGAAGNIYPHVREKTTYFLSVLGAAALLLLLVTCATAANLGVARMQTRARELRVRLAIGARPRHLLRLLVIEHGLLAAGAAVAGGLLATWIPSMFAAYTLPGSVPVAELPLRFEAAEAAFTAGLLLFLVFALTVLTSPSVRGRGLARPEFERPGGRLRIRRTLVAAQLAMSLALLFGGGLLFKALRSQIELDPAFRAQRLLMATIALPSAGAAGGETLRSIRQRVAASEGVFAASWTYMVPFGARRMQTSMTPEDSGQVSPVAFDANVVDVDYFRTVGVPITRGRAFAESDRHGAVRVVIVTESLAGRYWPGRDPIGRRLSGRTRDVPSWTVIGVVPDALHYDIRTLRSPRREYVFLPLAQMYGEGTPLNGSMTLLVGTTDAPLSVADRVRAIIGREAAWADPQITTARRHVDAALSQEWLAATTGGAIAALAAALAALGLYGIIRYAVFARRREMGIRIALGATPGAVIRLVAHETMLTIGAGTATGLAAALLLAAWLRPLLHGVRPSDPFVLAAAVGLTTAIAGIAAWLPARAAARIEPVEALRVE